jgi:hypothetical protein
MKRRIKKAGIFLVLTFVVSLIIYAQTPDDSVYVTDMTLSQFLPKALQQNSDSREWETCEDTESAGAALREAFRERKTEVTLMLTDDSIKDSDYNDVFTQIYDIALEHTGVGDEGDYLKWHLSQLDVSFAKSSGAFDIEIAYLDDDTMEDQTTQAVEEVEESLPISSDDSTYDIIYTVYDYLANSITYDKEDESELPHTAYDGIINGKAVCQGYALLFYRILLDYGIYNRMIVSDTHAWNLVDIDGEYYECDLTWDSQEAEMGNDYEYFLKADLSIDNTAHDWKSDVLDDEVYSLYRSETDYDVIA